MFLIFSSKNIEIGDSITIITTNSNKITTFAFTFLMKQKLKMNNFLIIVVHGLQSAYKFFDRQITAFSNLWCQFMVSN